MYVWLDALTNYITAVGYPDTESESLQGLLAGGSAHGRQGHPALPRGLLAGLPDGGRRSSRRKRVFAHGWWTSEGEKISKSLGNVIDPFEIVPRYGLDQVRYFLLREVPFGADGDFSHRAIVGRSNNDLANDFGNLAQRVLSMVAKNCGGAVPAPGPFTEPDEALLAAAGGLLARLRELYDAQALNRALEATWEVIGAANRYVDEQAPWALRKSDPARMGTVLYVVMEVLRHLAILSQPVMPDAMGRMLDQLGQPDGARGFADLATVLVPGTALPKPEGVFPRYQDDIAPAG